MLQLAAAATPSRRMPSPVRCTTTGRPPSPATRGIASSWTPPRARAGAEDFDGLTQHAAGCWEVTRASRLRSGARSTLTIGAALTEGRWFLLDPHQGTVGVCQQLDANADVIG